MVVVVVSSIVHVQLVGVSRCDHRPYAETCQQLAAWLRMEHRLGYY